MEKENKSIPVLLAPAIDPGSQRVELCMDVGKNVTEIVQAAAPDLPSEQYSHLRVVLVTQNGSTVIEQRLWSVVKPKPGVHVVIRVVPGKSILKQVLMIVVAIAAIALGQLWAPAAGAWGLSQSWWAGLIGAGVPLVGQLSVNAIALDE